MSESIERVVAVDRGRVLLLGGAWAAPAQHAPAAGDFVVVSAGIVQAIQPRRSAFVRKASGRENVAQVVAANVDRVLIVTAIGNDLNPRRLERYATVVWAGGAEPVVVINKADLAHDAGEVLAKVRGAVPDAPVVFTSATTDGALAALAVVLTPGTTVALVGSSGVGKSTLLNRLLGGERQRTAPVRESDERGRHTTTRAELVVAPSGVMVIDTPGMRELGLWDAGGGLELAFADIAELAQRCRFRDCRHGEEPDCAVRGQVAAPRLAAYRRLSAENQETAARVKSAQRAPRGRRRPHHKLGLTDD